MWEALSKTVSIAIGHSSEANLVLSLLVLIVGVTHLLFKTEPLGKHRFARQAFFYWLAMWLVHSTVYFCRTVGLELLPQFEVLLVDVNSLLMIGFSVAFIGGPKHRPKKLGLILVGALLFSILFHSLVGTVAVGAAAGSPWRVFWVSIPALLGIVSLLMFGEAFLLRFGWSAIVLPVAAVLYALLQWPVYMSVVVNLSANEHWFLWLALGKLVIGGLFYVYFLSSLGSYEAMTLRRLDTDERAALKRGYLGAAKAVSAVLLAIGGGFLATWLYQFYSG